MPAIQYGMTVEVCTVHMKSKINGVWSQRAWAQTMAMRHGLTLIEAVCPNCEGTVRRSFEALWAARYPPATRPAA